MGRLKRLKKGTERKKRYLKHYDKAGPEFAMTYAEWLQEGEKTAYYGKAKQPSDEARMREMHVRKKPIQLRRKKKK